MTASTDERIELPGAPAARPSAEFERMVDALQIACLGHADLCGSLEEMSARDALLAAFAALRAEIERLRELGLEWSGQIREQQAEIERLTRERETVVGWVCVRPDGKPALHSARASRDESIRVCFGIGLMVIDPQPYAGWCCVPLAFTAQPPLAEGE